MQGLDLEWCIAGCGKRNQLGSIYCGPSCFRDEILSQDEPLILDASVPLSGKSLNASTSAEIIQQYTSCSPVFHFQSPRNRKRNKSSNSLKSVSFSI
ncbi:hypothetical protein HDV01_006752 [Terramyces sp. JEL0728]|nr:hypothetical protein HDV01_006752 [Terramyces sp. JEL0728]